MIHRSKDMNFNSTWRSRATWLAIALTVAIGVAPAGAQAQDWKFVVELPPALAAIDEAAGFRREGLGARAIISRRRGEEGTR